MADIFGTKDLSVKDTSSLKTGDMRKGFQMLDELARSLKKTFYEIIFEFYEADEIQRHVDEWDKEKGL